MHTSNWRAQRERRRPTSKDQEPSAAPPIPPAWVPLAARRARPRLPHRPRPVQPSPRRLVLPRGSRLELQPGCRRHPRQHLTRRPAPAGLAKPFQVSPQARLRFPPQHLSRQSASLRPDAQYCPRCTLTQRARFPPPRQQRAPFRCGGKSAMPSCSCSSSHSCRAAHNPMKHSDKRHYRRRAHTAAAKLRTDPDPQTAAVTPLPWLRESPRRRPHGACASADHRLLRASPPASPPRGICCTTRGS